MHSMVLEVVFETISGALSSIVGQSSEWFWSMVQALVIGITAVYMAQQVKVQRRASMLDTLRGLLERWEDDRMLEARKEIATFYLDNTKPTGRITEQESRIAFFFEDIGAYLYYDCVPPKAIWDAYSYSIEHYWQLLEPKIFEFRKKSSDTTYFDKFEALSDAMSKVARRKGAPHGEKTESEMKRFLQGETELHTRAEL